jgi:hypothetical protein
MKKLALIFLFTVCLIIIFFQISFGQNPGPASTEYDQHKVFSPLFYGNNVTIKGIKFKYYYDQKTGFKINQHWDFTNNKNMEFTDY